MVRVRPFVPCTNVTCNVLLPLPEAAVVASCWACGTPRPAVPLPCPWPGAWHCPRCNRRVPAAPASQRTVCPWCGNDMGHAPALHEDEIDVLWPLARYLGFGDLASNRLLVEQDGHNVWTVPEDQGDIDSTRIVGIEIRLECGPVPRVRLVRESTMHRLGKALCLVSEVQTGDEAFDRAFFIRTEASAQEVRAHIRTMLDSVFDEVFTGQLRTAAMTALSLDAMFRGGSPLVSTNEGGAGAYVVCGRVPTERLSPETWLWAMAALGHLATMIAPVVPGHR
jgi:hypothetical protein